MKKQIITTASAVLGLTAILVSTSTEAREEYARQLKVYPTCTGCHTSQDNAQSWNLKSGAMDAWVKDWQGLTGLKAYLDAQAAPVPVPVIPTCKSTEVLTGNVCVAKRTPVPVVVTPTVIPTTTTNTNPVLNSVAQQWDAKVGEAFKIPLSVNDKEHDEFTMMGNVVGSKISRVYTDDKSLLPTVDFLWTPTAAQVNKIYTINFQAKEAKTKQKLTSNKVSVKIRVWAAGSAVSAAITKFNVSTSAWSAGKLTLTGNVVFNNLLTTTERQDFITKKLDLTIVSGNSGTGALVATTPLTLDSKGNWSVSFALTQAQVPCDITVQFDGQNAARTVAGCIKPVATVTPPVNLAMREEEYHEVDEHEGVEQTTTNEH